MTMTSAAPTPLDEVQAMYIGEGALEGRAQRDDALYDLQLAHSPCDRLRHLV